MSLAPSDDRHQGKRLIAEITLEGDLTAGALRTALATATKAIGAASDVGLIVDCTKMNGYELEARQVFVDWNRASRKQLARVAIVTSNPVWRMVISVMALAASVNMKPFDDRAAARRWLEG